MVAAGRQLSAPALQASAQPSTSSAAASPLQAPAGGRRRSRLCASTALQHTNGRR